MRTYDKWRKMKKGWAKKRVSRGSRENTDLLIAQSRWFWSGGGSRVWVNTFPSSNAKKGISIFQLGGYWESPEQKQRLGIRFLLCSFCPHLTPFIFLFFIFYFLFYFIFTLLRSSLWKNQMKKTRGYLLVRPIR